MVRFSLWHVTLLFWAVLCADVSATLDNDLDCNVASVVLMGDGRCDEEYNTQACGFDGGDCCECTCWDNEFSCGAMGYSCVDPDASCDKPGSLFRELAENNVSHSPTSSPSPSPTPGPRSATNEDSSDEETASASSSSSSSTSTGVIVGVSAAVVIIGVGMYFYRKNRSGARYDATGEYTSAGHLT